MFFLESAQDQPTFRGEVRQELDVRVSLFPYSNHWELALFVLNPADARHITQVTQLVALPNAAVNEPQRWGARPFGVFRFSKKYLVVRLRIGYASNGLVATMIEEIRNDRAKSPSRRR